MSFIDMTANDVWSEEDIKSRLHAEIRSEVSEFAETELNRALQGSALGMHTLTQQEQISLMHFKAATDRVALLGTTARANMVLLNKTFAFEVAKNRLAMPVVGSVIEGGLPAEDNTEALILDEVERANAQAVVDAVSLEVLSLYNLRNPTAPPEEVIV